MSRRTNISPSENRGLHDYRLLPLSGLVPYARNARTHSDAQVAQIAASIREFGWTNPILVDEQGGIIAGHGRVLAARKLDMAEVPAITLGGLSEAQKRALVLADNKLALNAGWDEELLRLELTDLQLEGFEPALVGFDAGEMEKLFGTEKAEDDGPLPGEGAYQEQYGVIVMCKSEAHQKDVYDALVAEGYEVKVVAT